VLWERVAAVGAVFSEAALGTPPHPRVFPARNRIIAGLSDVVVVVECHGRGGSLHTVEAAARRSIPVGAVPGAVHSPASRGTNGLLVDGCTPIRDVDDVLTALALARGGAPPVATRGSWRDPAPGLAPRHSLDRVEQAVWDAVEDVPTPVETVLLRTNLSLSVLAEVGDALVGRGVLVAGAGWWSRA
jgi:DNA processing protein